MLEMKVPSPGESITEVEIATWLVKDGDYVEKDQAIAEVDSDKATLELPAEEAGIIYLKAEEGDVVEVGQVVCHIDTSAAKPEGTAAPAAEAPKAPAPVAAAGDTTMNAPMPGSVSKIVAREGQVVKKGDVIIMLEAMKMQNEMASPVAGTVKSIAVSVGESVKPGQLMAIIG